MNNFILITTYIGSGVTDGTFLDQRMNILRYSTIPSIINQTNKNFIWCVYLDEINNPKDKLDELVKLFESYSDKIKIHIVKYKPFLSDGSLCVDNRARSCSSKRYELYLKSINYCKHMKYLDNINYISHLMLDDDDPILKDHISWINDKVNEYNLKLDDHIKAIIVINKNQYIFYLDHMSLTSITSTKAMKGSSFVFYSIESSLNIKFHPYSIIETIESNYEYKNKYGIDSKVVNDKPTWIYFRHQLSTSAYSKEFIVDEKNTVINGYTNIVKELDFYSSRRLERLVNSLKTEHKSIDIVNWKSFRNAEKKKICIIISDLKEYEAGLRLSLFLKNNFTVRVIVLEKNDINNNFIKKHMQFFSRNTYYCNKEDKLIMIDINKFHPDYVCFFGNIDKLYNLDRFLQTNKYMYDVINKNDKIHIILGKSIRTVVSWRNNEMVDIYQKLGDRLLKYKL